MGNSISNLPSDELNTLWESTHFDKRELQQWYKGFLRDCPSGRVMESDFVQLFKQFFPFGDPTDYCHYLFLIFELDKSKSIGFKELIVALSITSRGTMKEKLQWSFKLFDQKKTGKVTYDELLDVISSVYKMIGPMVTLNDDEKTPELKTEKFFTLLNKDKNKDTIVVDDLTQLLKLDPTILNALNCYGGII